MAEITTRLARFYSSPSLARESPPSRSTRVLSGRNRRFVSERIGAAVGAAVGESKLCARRRVRSLTRELPRRVGDSAASLQSTHGHAARRGTAGELPAARQAVALLPPHRSSQAAASRRRRCREERRLDVTPWPGRAGAGGAAERRWWSGII